MSAVRKHLFGPITTSLGPSCTSHTIKSNFIIHNLPAASNLCSFNKVIDWSLQHAGKRRDGIVSVYPVFVYQQPNKDSSVKCSINSSEKNCLINSAVHLSCTSYPVHVSAQSYFRAYSSHVEGKENGLRNAAEVPSSTSIKAMTDNATPAGSEWIESVKRTCQSTSDTVINAGEKVKEMSNEVFYPYLHQIYHSSPYMENIMVPIGSTLVGALLAWLVMPTILRKLHRYSQQSPFPVFGKSFSKEQVPYERSLWSALEDPARYLFTFMAFSQLGVILVSTATPYLSQAWRGAVVLSFVWFLFRWKTIFFSRVLASEASRTIDRDKLLTLEKVSSVGLLVLAAMAAAEACGVPVQSILTVGGIGGVATAFAARDILGNLLSGLSLQFSRPFSVGDNIKAGQIEGQVVEMGLTATSLINTEKFPVIVPNSLLSSQVIVNKSRAQWRASLAKIPIRVSDLEKIPLISEEIQTMLRTNPKVLDSDDPCCYLSRVENTFAELTISYNLKNMKKDDFFAAEQDVLLQAVKIIKKHGADLGSTLG